MFQLFSTNLYAISQEAFKIYEKNSDRMSHYKDLLYILFGAVSSTSFMPETKKQVDLERTTTN